MPANKYSGGCVMLWVCFSSKGPENLRIMTEKITKMVFGTDEISLLIYLIQIKVYTKKHRKHLIYVCDKLDV